jgi:hypothetical protein
MNTGVFLHSGPGPAYKAEIGGTFTGNPKSTRIKENPPHERKPLHGKKGKNNY